MPDRSNCITAMLTNILATGNWGDLPILADYLLDTMTTANCQQRQADAAWLRTARAFNIHRGGMFFDWAISVDEDHFYDCEDSAIAELFRRVCERLGYQRVHCKRCGPYEKCPYCDGRTFVLRPIERVPCQRCGGKGRSERMVQGEYGWEMLEPQCLACQGQGTVAKEPA